jgi:hypothetical protein
MTAIVDELMPCIGIGGRCIRMCGCMRDILCQSEETGCAGVVQGFAGRELP